MERLNKEILRHLRGLVFDKKIKDDWSMVLPLVQRIMNATLHVSTGVSPTISFR